MRRHIVKCVWFSVIIILAVHQLSLFSPMSIFVTNISISSIHFHPNFPSHAKLCKSRLYQASILKAQNNPRKERYRYPILWATKDSYNDLSHRYIFSHRNWGWNDARLQHADGGSIFQEKERISRNFYRLRKRLGYSSHVCVYKRSNHVRTLNCNK